MLISLSLGVCLVPEIGKITVINFQSFIAIQNFWDCMYFSSKKKGRGGVLVSNCAKQKLYNHSVCVYRGRT